MANTPHDRRESDRRETDRRAFDVLRFVREWAPVAVAALAWTGTQVSGAGSRLSAIEHEQAVDRIRDSLSIADRVAFADAISTLGRIGCRALGTDAANDRGIPCALLLSGERWPLLHVARTASRGLGPVAPSFAPYGPLPIAAIAPLLIPVVPTPDAAKLTADGETDE